jgi:hypothetical protein
MSHREKIRPNADAILRRRADRDSLHAQLTRLMSGWRKRADKVRWLISAMTIAHLLLTGAAQADEILIGDDVVKRFGIPDGSISPDLKLAETTVSLVGEPDSKSFGLSFRGLLDPETDLSGKELKLVGYFYARCDNESPDKTKGILIGSVDLADIKAGRDAYTLIVTAAEASAFVPLKNVDCVKVGVR